MKFCNLIFFVDKYPNYLQFFLNTSETAKIEKYINFGKGLCYFVINLFVPNAPFLYPLKTSENRKVF